MSWGARIWNVMRPGRKQRDLDRELAFHVRERAEELQAEGMSEIEAQRSARLNFGNHTSYVERTRDMDINQRIDSMARHFRLAARSLAKAPAFTATVVLTLALGIGANSAVFSAIYAVLLRPLPFPDAGRLVTLAQVTRNNSPVIAPIRLEDWNRLNKSFTAISGYYSQDDSELSGELPEKLHRALVAPRFMQVWGVAPALGRDFTPEEEHFGGPNAVIISDRLWRRKFAADPKVIGKMLRFGRTGVPIVGVMPASFHGAEREVDLWSVSPADAPYSKGRELTWFAGIGRLKPGVQLEQARANLSAVQASLAKQFPATDAKIGVSIEPLKEAKVGGVRKSLWILFGSVSLLLMIACTNVAALLLARSAGRAHEISVRFSLGASRASVAAQLLAESMLLALAGAALGLAFAGIASSAFRTLAKDLPRIEEVGLNWGIVVYTLLCSVAVALACGILPAIRGTRRNLTGSLAAAGRSQVSGRNAVQFTLVAVQVALAVTLLCGAGLLVRSFQALGRISPGFDPEHVLTFHISSSWSETVDGKAAKQRLYRILDAVRATPGVEAASTAYNLPGVPADFPVEVTTSQGRAGSELKMTAQGRTVTPTYFATLHIPLLAGEVCRDESPTAMMVNSSFAKAYLGGATAVGQQIQPVTPNLYIPRATIRGIVGDARELGLDRAPVPTVYWCFGPSQPGTFFLARTHGDPLAMTETIRRTIRQIEPQRSVYDLTPLTSHISDAYAENYLRTVLLAFFALTAVSLASVGLYGSLSYMVNLRKREVGLRLALGAMRAQVVRHFLAQGLGIAMAGCVAGLALTAVFGKVLAGMLYGVSPSDATTLGCVVALVAAVAAAASLVPAIRAARLEPMQVLRDE